MGEGRGRDWMGWYIIALDLNPVSSGGRREKGREGCWKGGWKAGKRRANKFIIFKPCVIDFSFCMDAYKTPSYNQPCWSISHTHTQKYAFVYNEMAKKKKNGNCLAQGCQTFRSPEHHWGICNRIILIIQHWLVNSVPIGESESKSIKITIASV